MVPIVAPPNKSCAFAADSGPRAVRFDLHNYNRPGVGWERAVRVEGQGRDALLRYEPCGSLHCPIGAHCQGIEDAAVWLCANESGIELCTAFGLIEDDVRIALADGERIENGLIVNYIGDMRHEAEAKFVCAQEEIGLPEKVAINDRTLSFVVRSEAACAIGEVKSASGGAIFLTTLWAPCILYFAGGVFWALFRTGVPGIPNVRFWREAYDLVATGASGIFGGCRNKGAESRESLPDSSSQN
jgi:hypothetical protein